MPLDDPINPQNVLDDVIRQNAPDLAGGGVVDPKMMMDRLIRRNVYGQKPQAQPKPQQQPGSDFGKYGRDPEGPQDFGSFGRDPEPEQPAAAAQPEKPSGDWSFGEGASVAGRSAGQAAVKAVGSIAKAGALGPELEQQARDQLQPGVSDDYAELAAPYGKEVKAREREQAAARDRLAEKRSVPIAQRPAFKAGQAIQDYAKDWVTPQEQAKYPITSQAAGMVGGAVPVVAAGAATAPFGGPVGAMGVAGALMAAQSAGDEFDKAKAAGASDEKAAESAGLSGVIMGASGALPVGVILAPAKQMAPGLVGRMWATLDHAWKSGVTFATVGEAQHFVGEQLAKEYDPNAHYDFDYKRVVSEFLAGGVLGGAHTAVSPRPGEVRSDTAGDTTAGAEAEPGPTPSAGPRAGLPPPGAERAETAAGSASAGARESPGAPPKPPPFETGLNPKVRSTLEEKAAYYKEYGADDIAAWDDERLKTYVNTKSGAGKYASDEEILRRAGHSDDDIGAMSPEEKNAAVDEAKGFGVHAGAEPEEAVREGTRKAPVEPQTAEDVARAASVADQDHSPAQGEANNVQRGHMRWQGLDITIEAPAGGVRRGTAPDGTPFETTHAHPYGYFKGLPAAADGQHPDVTVGEHPTAPTAFVIDEVDPKTGKYRQSKSFVGFQTPQAAIESYLSISSKDHSHLGGMRAFPVDEFVSLAKAGGLTKPVSEAMEARSPTKPNADSLKFGERSGGEKKVGPEADDANVAGDVTELGNVAMDRGRPVAPGAGNGAVGKLKAEDLAVRRQGNVSGRDREGDALSPSAAAGVVPKVSTRVGLSPEAVSLAAKRQGQSVGHADSPSAEPTISASPEHHEAVVEAVRSTGADPAQVDKADLDRAAELHAWGAPPHDAFVVAVTRNLIDAGYILPEQVKEAIGDAAAQDFMEASNGAKRGARAETRRAAAGGEVAARKGDQPEGGAETGAREGTEAVRGEAGEGGKPEARSPKAGRGAADDAAGGKRAAAAGAEKPAGAESARGVQAAGHEATRDAAKAPVKVKPEKKQSLLQFLASRGGIDPRDPMVADVRAILGTMNKFVPGYGPLIRKSGNRLDNHREAAVEAGYLQDAGRKSGSVNETTIKTLLDRLDDELREAKPSGAALEQHEARLEELDGARGKIRDALKEIKYPHEQLLPEDMTRAAELVLDRDMDPLDAVERAVIEGEQSTADAMVTPDDSDYIEFEDLDHALERRPAYAAREAPAEQSAAGTEVAAAENAEAGRVARRAGAGAGGRPQPVAAEPERKPVTERTAAGEQSVLPGAERIADRELAQRRADTGLKAKKEQKPADEGLFGDESKQADLVDMARKAPPAKPAKKAEVASKKARETGPSDSEAMPDVVASIAKPVPGLYSAVGRAINSAKQERATPNHWLGMLRNAPGVKPEEIQWLGLEEWLRDHKGPVTKQELADYVRANSIKLTEVTKSAGGPRPTTRDADAVLDWAEKTGKAHLSDAQSIIGAFEESERGGRATAAALEELGAPDHLLEPFRNYAGGEDGPKFSSYTLPGGENYREMLLTLPERMPPDVPGRVEARPASDGRGWVVWDKQKDELMVRQEGGGMSEADARRQAAMINGGQRDFDGENYRSSHWDEPNVLAHVRFNDRVIDGRKTLFLEEIQSDLHQQGKRSGYRPKDAAAEVVRREAAVEEMRPSVNQMLERNDRLGFDSIGEARRAIAHEDASAWEFETPDDLTLARRFRDSISALGEAKKAVDQGVPDAPFKTTWPELSLKRMVRYAAEHGYEKIAWTRGETQAARYDLSKQVKSIVATRRPSDGAFNLVAESIEGNPHSLGMVPREKLADHVGKDLAEKIEKQGDGHHTYSGLDLKVGGEGMSAFYNKMLPAAANKLTKKFGGRVAQAELGIPESAPERDTPFVVTDRDGVVVETGIIDENVAAERARELGGSYRFEGVWAEIVERPEGWMGHSRRFDLVNGDGVIEGHWATRQEADAHLAEYLRAEPARKEAVHTLDITPAMRIAAMGEGFPMFKVGQRPTPGKDKLAPAGNAATFAGAHALTADQSALDEAMRLEAAGTDPKDIWQRTGWRKRPDGWRFEIDDSKVDFRPSVLKSAARRHGAEDQVYRYQGRLGDLIDAPDLFAAYPDLKDVDIRIGDPTSFTASGGIDPRTRAIDIVAHGNKDELLNTLVHEVQHAIQLREGFDAGGNAGTLRARTEVALYDLTQQIAKLRPGSNIRAELEQMRRQLREQVKRFGGGISGWSVTNLEHDAYVRLLGEVEARNTTLRRELPAEARRRIFPGDTEDVPADQQYRGSDLVLMDTKHAALTDRLVRDGYTLRGAGREEDGRTRWEGINIDDIAGKRSNIVDTMLFSPEGIAKAVKTYGAQALRDVLEPKIARFRSEAAETRSGAEHSGRRDLYQRMQERAAATEQKAEWTEQTVALLDHIIEKHPELAERPGYRVQAADREGLLEPYKGHTWSEDEVAALKQRVEKTIDKLEQDGTLTPEQAHAARYDFDAQGIEVGLVQWHPEEFAKIREADKALVDEYRAASDYVSYATHKANAGLSWSRGFARPVTAPASRLTPAALQRRADIESMLTEIVRRVTGGNTSVEFFPGESVPIPGGTDGWGTYGEGRPAQAAYLGAERIIRLALQGQDPRSSAYHEAFHDIESKLLTPREQETIVADTPRLRPYVMRHYGFTPEEMAEIKGYEVRAMAFEAYVEDREKGGRGNGLFNSFRRAFEKLRHFLNAVRNFLSGFGFHTIEDIFAKAHEGKFADRDAAAGSDENMARLFTRRRGGPPPSSEAETSVLGRIVPSEKGRALPKDLNAIYTALKDDLHPIAVVTKELSGGRHLPTEKDPYKLARLTRGSYGKAEQFLKYGTFDYETLQNNGPSLSDILKPVENNLDGFRAYAVSRRAIELEDRGIRTGVPYDEAKAVVAAGDHYRDTFESVVGYQNRLTDYLQASGILSADGVRAMRVANKDYLPFFRLMDQDKEFGQQLGGGLKTRNPIKGIKGSNRFIVDPIESIVKNTYLFVSLAERNRALRALEDLAAGSTVGTEYMQRVRQKMHPIEVTAQEINRHLRGIGSDEEVSDAMTVFRPNAFRPAPDEIAIWHDGKRRIYKVGREVAEAVNALDRDSLNIMTRILSIPAKMLRAGAVLSPEFIARNPVRDQFSALSFSENGYVPVYDLVRGLGHLLKKGDVFQDWLKGGGANAAMVALDRHYISQNIIKLTKPSLLRRGAHIAMTPIELLRMFSETLENASRLGEFGRAREAGKTAMTGAFESRELTLDFARVGAQTKSINALIPFWNAQVEGVDRGARAFKTHPFRTLLMVGLSITLPSILLWLGNKDDDRYRELPKWEKDFFWHIITDNWVNISDKDALKVPNSSKRKVGAQWMQNKGTIWKIPKPFELGVLFGSVPERVLEAFFTDNPDAFKDLHKSVLQALLPNWIPQVAQPFIEQFANRSTFTDRNLVPKYLESLLPKYQAQPFTSETAQILGNLISKMNENTSFASPLAIENYVREWTGGLGMHALAVVDKGLEAAGLTPDRVKPTSTLSDMPVIKGFVSRYPSANAQSVQKFYDTYGERKKAADTVKYLSKTGEFAQAKAERDSHNVFPPAAETYHKALGEQSKFIRDVYRDMKMTPSEKRQIIDATYLQMIEIAKRGNDFFVRTEKSSRPRPSPAEAAHAP